MRLPRPAHRKTIAAILSNYFSSASMPSIVALLVLSLLGAAAGCKKNTSTAEEQPSAAAPIPAPVAKPAVAAQPTPASELPDWKPVSATTATIEIPVVKGLLEDSAISSVNGDLENFDKILDMNPTTITKEVEDEIAPKTPGGHPQNLNGPPAAPGKGKVLIDVADMASSHRVVLFFHNNQTQHYPGSLDRGISTETLNGLRAGKVVEWQNSVDFGQALLQAQKGHRPPTMLDWADLNLTQCNLQRVEPVDLAAPVLVNNEPVELPALHAKCVLDNGTENHFYILNQPSNPLFLYTKMAISGDSSQTIKITFDANAERPGTLMKAGEMPSSGGGAGIEKKLAEKEPVEIYGIYFDFNSAFIKPESETVLKQIADVMHKNPTWKLSVAGHTDNIGGDDFNLKLSQARSAAVKAALVKDYKIAPDRLTTSGFGASKPIADNAKVEGRARNRRVELQRQ